jgi:hypothetical protein
MMFNHENQLKRSNQNESSRSKTNQRSNKSGQILAIQKVSLTRKYVVTSFGLIYACLVLAWSWTARAESTFDHIESEISENTPLVKVQLLGKVIGCYPRLGTFLSAKINGQEVVVELRGSSGGIFVAEDYNFDFSSLSGQQVQVKGYAVVRGERAHFRAGPIDQINPDQVRTRSIWDQDRLLFEQQGQNIFSFATTEQAPTPMEIALKHQPVSLSIILGEKDGMARAIVLVESLRIYDQENDDFQ